MIDAESTAAGASARSVAPTSSRSTTTPEVPDTITVNAPVPSSATGTVRREPGCTSTFWYFAGAVAPPAAMTVSDRRLADRALGFSTTSGIYVLDIVDHFINRFGILLVAVVSMVVIAWGVRALPRLRDHLNRDGSVPVRGWWIALVSVVTPLALAFILVRELLAVIEEPYGGYPQWMLVVFGWLAAALVAVAGFAIARVPWRPETSLDVGDRPENDTTARSQP